MKGKWVWVIVAAVAVGAIAVVIPRITRLTAAASATPAQSTCSAQPQDDRFKLSAKDFAAAGIALNMDWRKVRKVLGQPTSTSRERNDEIGSYFETWKYPGLEVTFMYSIEWGDAHPCESGQVMFILFSGRQYETARGVHPGDARDRVTALYGPPSSEGDSTVYYDTEDGVSYLGFHLKERKVTAIRIENTLF